MAATNFTPIQLYFSTTASAVPTAANLAQGELAINITDGKLYYEDNAGAVQVIATKGAGTIGGSTTQIQYNNAGALAGNAAMVFNNSTNVTTLTTLNLTNALGAIYGGTAQSTYTQGDFLYASASNTLAKLGIGANTYILTSTGTVPQWVAPSSIAVLTATNLAGGLAGSVPYQSALDTTTFLSIGSANRVMTSTGSAPQWVTSLTGLTGVSSSGITNTSLTSGRVVVSTTGGLQADDSDLTFDGTTLSAGGLSTGGLSTLVKTVKIGDSSFNGVAVFAAATPAKLYMGTGTVTDVTSAISATNAIGAIATLGITPIAATNTSVTYTNASTLYIAGAPSAGTNVTLTNPYSLYVAGGASYFGGAVDFAVTPSYSGGTANGVMYLNGSKQITTGSALTFDGSAFAVTGTLSATGAVTFTGTTATLSGTGLGASNTILSVGNSTDSDAQLRLRPNSVEKSWSIGASTLTASALTITPSTTNGGSTFTTPVISITSSGLEVTQSQLIGYSSYAGIGTNGLAVAGNVGIGTASPISKLHVFKSSDNQLQLQCDNTGTVTIDMGGTTTPAKGGIRFSDNSGSLFLRTNSTTQVTLDSAGSLGLGVTPSAFSAGYVGLQFGGNPVIASQNNLAIAGNAYYNSGWKYIASNYASRYDSNFNNGGIHAWFRSTSAQVAGTDPVFDQAMTLDASGNLLVGGTSTSPSSSNVNGFAVISSGYISLTGSGTSAIDCNRTNDGIIQAFRQSGNIVGNISVTTLLTTYNTTSDYRLKTVIGAVADSGSRIDALQPVEYTWNSNGSRTRGFLAHQFQEIYAGSVTGTKDAVDAKGKPVYQAMQASTPEVIADLVAEIQSLRKRLATLEAK